MDDEALLDHLRTFGAGQHKGKPAVSGNICREFLGAAKTYIREHIYNPPTSLEPDRQSYDRYHPAVTIAFRDGNTFYTLNLHREAARAAYEALEQIFETGRQ